MTVGISLNFYLNENFAFQNPEYLQFVLASGLISVPLNLIATDLPFNITLNKNAILTR